MLAAAAPQCAWLLAAGGGSLGWRVLATLGCVGLLVAPLVVRSVELQGGRAMALVAGSLGGLGMLCGTLLDQLGPGAVPPCHAALARAFWPQLNWMNGLMFATCVPGCIWLCPLCGRLRGRVLVHAVSALGMFLGMVLGARVLAALAGGARWARYSGCMHLAMLAGMMLGTLAVYVTLARWALRPERS